jgi:hypothetical protein
LGSGVKWALRLARFGWREEIADAPMGKLGLGRSQPRIGTNFLQLFLLAEIAQRVGRRRASGRGGALLVAVLFFFLIWRAELKGLAETLSPTS